MCDVDSSIYLPFLEETGYMPKHRYSSGQEIREYLGMICDRYNLRSRAVFQSAVDDLKWEKDHWTAKITEKPKGGEQAKVTLQANYVMFSSGPLGAPQLPGITGFDDFGGDIFHTGRWNYSITGGSQEGPSMTGLEDKRVAFIGTGATAVQAVPQLAEWAKELYVVQRTPSAVDVRANRPVDPEEWKKITAKKGWQTERNMNMSAFANDREPKPKVNLIDDGFSRLIAISALIGGPKKVTLENVEAHVKYLQEADIPRQEAIRKRVMDTVKDKETATVSLRLPGL
jgi:cation diffusion facilitator CzcD-associated flavoprotein CzcO